MNFRTMKNGLMVAAMGVALLGAGSMAHATTLELNMYGASAQYKYWASVAPVFLNTKFQCTGSAGAGTLPDQDTDAASAKLGVTHGYNCVGVPGGHSDVIMRYASRASYDSIFAITGASQYPYNPADPAQPWLPGDPDDCDSDGDIYENTHLRLQCVDVNPAGFCAKACYDVNIGASDVDETSFVQESHGNLNWNTAPRQQMDRKFDRAVSKNGPRCNINSEDAQNLVVPFTFFVNKTVTAQQCDRSLGATTNIDGMCISDADCGGVVGSCAYTPLKNVSRVMAVNIFSRTAREWDDFGTWFVNGIPNVPIVACARHAGSGTHATLDWAVMQFSGKSLQKDEVLPGAADSVYYFNESSSNNMSCVNGNDYAITYADADQTPSANTVKCKYNGYDAIRANVRNGLYDNFWSFVHLYRCTNLNSANQESLITTHLYPYIKDGTKLTGSNALYFSTYNEMRWRKGTDRTYPTTRVANPTNPIAP